MCAQEINDTNEATDQLTIGDTTFRTGGNILFEKDEGKYYSAESAAMEKMDKAVQSSIVENGMQSLLKKIRG